MGKSLLIAGDLVPTGSNISLFRNGDIKSLVGDGMLDLFSKDAQLIFNLEVPLTNEKTPIDKCGPNLAAPADSINGIKALDPALITLANNHILDQGIRGLKSTIELLKGFDIPFIGAGDNISEARRPYTLNVDGKKIGIYACAEHEFSIADENHPGANPFDPLESLDHIAALKSGCDHVIVLYHGGKEHYRYPSPYLRRVCRKIAQKGADLVICQHSHCVGCYEHHDGSTIVYGQGNFIFDYKDSEFWRTSLLLRVSADERLSVEYIPIVKSGNGIRLALGKEADDIMAAFYERSNEIKREGFIEQQYEQFAKEHFPSYVRNVGGFGKWSSRIDYRIFKGALARRKYSKKQLLEVINCFECEAHRELFIESVKVKMK